MEDRFRALLWAQEPGWTKMLSWLLFEAGFDVTHVTSQSQLVALLAKLPFSVAIVDVDDLAILGEYLVQQVRKARPDLPVILVSSQSNEPAALPGLRDSLYAFVHRPDDLDQLAISAREAACVQGSSARCPAFPGKLAGGEPNGHAAESLDAVTDPLDLASRVFVGETSSIRQARRLVAQVAPSDMTVLIRGESGTGKEVVARLIHSLSRRSRSGDFVKINCPAIPEALLESELFGYERGAFTGAVSQKPGRFELAEGGTVFLDEIGLLSTGMQSKILEVIEHKQFVRVGGKKTIRVDARIVAATNSPLETMIANGTFRADLFYRLRQFSITLPPLRERVEDIPILCDHFLQTCARQEIYRHTILPAEVLPFLIRHDWPGNVRELQGLIERFALCGDTDALKQATGHGSASRAEWPEDDRLDATEKAAILAALAECRWNRRLAAANLGISYSALRRRMAKHSIDGNGSSIVHQARPSIRHMPHEGEMHLS